MLAIQSVLDAAKSVKSTDSVADANRKLMAICFEYCKRHQKAEELILIVSVRGLKPFLYSHSFDFSVENIHERVQNSLRKARKAMDADIVVLEWFTLQEQKNPYYVLSA